MAEGKSALSREDQPRVDDGPRAKAVLERIRAFTITGVAARNALREARYQDWREQQGLPVTAVDATDG